MQKITGTPEISYSKAKAAVTSPTPVQNIVSAPVEESDTDEEGVVSGVELDSEGLPWDERIHSGSKKTKADGTWCKRKGVDDEVWDSVRSELKAKMAPPIPQTQQAAPVIVEPLTQQVYQPQPQTHVAPPMTQTQQAAPVVAPPMPQTQQAAPVVAQTQVAPPIPQTQQAAPVVAQNPVQAAAVATTGGDFTALLTKINVAVTSGQIDQAYIAGALVEMGNQFGITLNAITDIMNNQPLIDHFWAILARDGK